MILLGIDTCEGHCSIALMLDGKIIQEINDWEHARHSEQLLPMINKILQENNYKYQDLQGVVVTVGPGSFTGIRSGIAVAKGIHISCNIPIYGVTTGQAILGSIKLNIGSNIYVLLDARREQIYLESFDNKLLPICKPVVIDYNECEKNLLPGSLIIGSGVGKIMFNNTEPYKTLEKNIEHASATGALHYFNLMLSTDHLDIIKSSKDVVPLYVRPPDAKLPQ